MEGDIGGNTEFLSDVKAAAIYFPWTDAFTFGEEQLKKYPNEPQRISQCDGPNAPLGCIIGFSGPGKVMGELKKHINDPNEYYRKLIDIAKDASPVYHVTEKSAPSVLVHGEFEYGVQIPLGQSMRMFEALTRKKVKSLVLLNNMGPYGQDPEVKQAVLDFITSRV